MEVGEWPESTEERYKAVKGGKIYCVSFFKTVSHKIFYYYFSLETVDI